MTKQTDTVTIYCPFTGATVTAKVSDLDRDFEDIMSRVRRTMAAREATAEEEREHRAIMATLPGV